MKIDQKLVYLFLAIAMSVIALAPIWPGHDAIFNGVMDFGLRIGVIVPSQDSNEYYHGLITDIYGIVRILFMVGSFGFSVSCIALMRSKKTWPRTLLIVSIVAQSIYLIATLLMSWELFKYPGTWATMAVIAVAAKFIFDNQEKPKFQPSLRP